MHGASTPKLNHSPSFACVAGHMSTGIERPSGFESQFVISWLCELYNVALYS